MQIYSVILVAAAAASRVGIGARVERMAAAAGADRVRVEDAEAAAHQAILVVNLRARYVLGAHLVHVQLEALHVKRQVVLGGLSSKAMP